MARRTKAREVVVQMLYLRDLNPDVDSETIHTLIDEQLRSPDLREFAWRLFVGVMEFRAQIDERLQEAAENWAIKRMAPTDRNVLRLGAYELLQTDTPHRVVLDEAIELAKRFGSRQSSQFVNGVLDQVVPAERRGEGRTSTGTSANEGKTIETESLRLVPANEESLTAALAGPLELGNALGVTVPTTWPPEHFDAEALAFARDRVAEGPEQDGWWTYFLVHVHDSVLVGAGGFKGPPDGTGTVEIGYSIVPDFRRRGYATEAVRGLVGRAFGRSDVRRVVGDTLPLLTPSIRTLESCGFQPADESPEPGVLRFELFAPLRRGTTGHRHVADPDLPEVDLRGFRRDLHAVCRSFGATIVRAHGRVSVVGRNHVDGLIEVDGEELVVLVNVIHPYVAMCRSLDRPIAFVDHEPFQAALAATGTYRVLTRRELDQPVTPSLVCELADAEIEQLNYWKPATVGDLIFNWWD